MGVMTKLMSDMISQKKETEENLQKKIK